MFHRHIDRFAKPLPVGFNNNKLIDHHLDTVVFVPVNLVTVGHLTNFAIDPRIEKSFFADLFKQFSIVPFSVPNNGCKDHGFLSGKFFNDQVNNLIIRIFNHLFTGIVGVGFTGSCKKQAKKVIDFGNRAYS